uniref:Predicted protein n=1 Tax=Physcomitrium patens TaxID=3218 RepID=A9U7G6_PHYPA
MLDGRMTYTCGYWSGGARTLQEAQETKLDMICRKLELKPGLRLLDIGCGWGSLMGFAAEHYGVRCVGVTISKEQAAWAAERYKGLPIEFRLQDYRTVSEKFDRIASVGMFEHVGRKNHRTYMEVAHRCLADGGLFLLHTIGKNIRDATPDPWIDKYIFPNGDLPSLGQIGDACDGLFVAEDLHNFGADYDKTLMAWHANFEHAWPRFKDRLGEHFYRMWSYYLLSCAGAFRARDIQLWQWVLSKKGVPGGYQRATQPSIARYRPSIEETLTLASHLDFQTALARLEVRAEDRVPRLLALRADVEQIQQRPVEHVGPVGSSHQLGRCKVADRLRRPQKHRDFIAGGGLRVPCVVARMPHILAMIRGVEKMAGMRALILHETVQQACNDTVVIEQGVVVLVAHRNDPGHPSRAFHL